MSCFSLSCAVKPQKDSDDATISAEARTRTERDRQTHTHTHVLKTRTKQKTCTLPPMMVAECNYRFIESAFSARL